MFPWKRRKLTPQERGKLTDQMFPYTGPKMTPEQQEARDDALYAEAQSRFRMSMLCSRTVNELNTPLCCRIVELAAVARSSAWEVKTYRQKSNA